jgi:hypothetical protein
MNKRWQLREAKGQSLVEMALALPLLLLMFAGLIEIGAALRNYLVVVNANREGTRLAARGRWFDSDQDRQALFERVIAAAGVDQRSDGTLVQFLRPQAIDDMPANTTIRMYYVEVPDQIDEVGGLTDEPVEIHGPWYTGTLHLDREGIDVAEEAARAKAENTAFNKQYFIDEKLLDIPSEDNFVLVEVWYEHEQLLKLPIFTAILPEEFTLYSHSTMRVTLDSRID